MGEKGSIIPEVKALLQARIDALVRHCAPDGRASHGYWFARNPTRSDTNPGSFWIILSRPGKTPGAWRDEATGEKGDVLDLIAYTQRLERAAALKWAQDWLGFKQMPPTEVARARLAAEEKAQEADRLAARRLAEDQERAGAVFRKSKIERFAGSIADRYLRSRGIEVARFPRMPGCLGYIPRMRHAETNTHWPVLVAGMSNGRQMLAVHRTFLAPDGSGKAPVTPVRKIWPSFKGLSIPLWRGETELPPDEAAEYGLIDTLAIVEGVEDGLSVALARPDLRVWAAGSLGNIAHMALPPCSHEVIVCADNDWGKPQAEKLLKAACETLARTGRKVKVARSPIGKDMNDALRAGAEWAAEAQSKDGAAA